MERFLIGFIGTLLLFGVALAVMALMAAAFYFLGPVGGTATMVLAFAALAGACNMGTA